MNEMRNKKINTDAILNNDYSNLKVIISHDVFSITHYDQMINIPTSSTINIKIVKGSVGSDKVASIFIKWGENCEVLEFGSGEVNYQLADNSFEYLKNRVKSLSTRRLVKRSIKYGLKGAIYVSGILLLLNINAALFNLSSSFGEHPSKEPVIISNTPSLLKKEMKGIIIDREQPSLGTSPIKPDNRADTERDKYSKIAKKLEEGVQTGDYSVSLSDNVDKSKPVLYVFSDPACPHCRNAEPILEDLVSRGVNVHIFPVTVIGKEVSKKALTSVFCEGTGAIRNGWKKLTNTRIDNWNSLPSDSCAANDAIVENNNNFYWYAGYEGTPAFIRGDGTPYPISNPVNADAMKSWLLEGQ
jgi:TrbB protein